MGGLTVQAQGRPARQMDGGWRRLAWRRLHCHPTMPARPSVPPGHAIQRIGYEPPPSYELDLEIFSFRSLASRVPAEDLASAHRIQFHELICVTRGECTHVIDFAPIRCGPGSLLVSHPSQTEQFDVQSTWDGWLVLFRPEFLFSRSEGRERVTTELNLVALLSGLPAHLRMAAPEFKLIRGVLERMHEDTQSDGPPHEANALLRHQLCALLLRLARAQRLQQQGQPAVAPAELQRFQRFRDLVEQSFRRWHHVGAYANALGCTEKTLTRAALAVVGSSAKAFIANRVALEAKRLLVHTTLQVGVIAVDLGFQDASNFVKFFKRETGRTPMQFRGGYERA
jgi:AraC-like DNA-binding protein